MSPPPGADTEAATDGLAFFLIELVTIANLLPVNPFSCQNKNIQQANNTKRHEKAHPDIHNPTINTEGKSRLRYRPFCSFFNHQQRQYNDRQQLREKTGNTIAPNEGYYPIIYGDY